MKVATGTGCCGIEISADTYIIVASVLQPREWVMCSLSLIVTDNILSICSRQWWHSTFILAITELRANIIMQVSCSNFRWYFFPELSHVCRPNDGTNAVEKELFHLLRRKFSRVKHTQAAKVMCHVITFRVSRRRREMYCGHACLCVYVCLHAYGIARTRM